jgi:hypothetical protein
MSDPEIFVRALEALNRLSGGLIGAVLALLARLLLKHFSKKPRRQLSDDEQEMRQHMLDRYGELLRDQNVSIEISASVIRDGMEVPIAHIVIKLDNFVNPDKSDVGKK